MKEKEIKIKTKDGKTIYGILRGSLKRPIVVIVHGLSGNMNEAMHYNAARYFDVHGFSSFRFNLYAWEKDARKLHECTLKTHGQDIDAVVNYLKRLGAKKLFAAGHSYGWLSIVHANPKNFIALSSWDGSRLPANHFKNLPKLNKPKGRILDEGYLIIMGEKMAAYASESDTTKLIKNFIQPIQFVTTPEPPATGNLAEAKRLYKIMPNKKELLIVKGATHNFTEDGTQEQLYKATANWFKKFL